MPFLKSNGINLHYELEGRGSPLLLIHGLGSSVRDWEFQIPFFKQYYQVLTFDLRGHGKSDKPDHPYSVDLFTKDTAELIKTLFPEGLHVVGHSLGGMIAFTLALDYPELVKTLTVVNSAPAVIFPNIKSHFFFFLRAIDVRLFGMRHLSTHLAKLLFPEIGQTALRNKFIERWCENDPKAYLNSLRAFKDWNVMPHLGKIMCPTLIVSADQDYTPLSFKIMYTNLIPNAELVVIKNSRHISIVDQPEIFNQILAKFLGKNIT